MQHHMKGWTIWIALVAMMSMAASGCGDTPTDDTPVNNAGEDAGDEDTGDEDAGDPGDTEDPEDVDEPDEDPVCEPNVCGADACGMVDNGCGEQMDCGECEEVCEPTVAECPANSCGLIDNGCGESMFCGECNCLDGVPAEETCGVCGLGARVCGEGENGPGTCDEPGVPGLVDENCQAILYVNPAGAEGSGAPDSPRSNLQLALNDAESRFPAIVVVAETTEEQAVTGPILIPNGVVVLGGYRAANWQRQLEGRTHIMTPTMAGDLEGLVAANITSPTVVENFNVRTANATTPGASTIGVKVQDSSELTLRRVDAIPGQPADGSHGQQGAAGNPGGPGGDGLIFNISGNWTSHMPNEGNGDGFANPECVGFAQNGKIGGRGYLLTSPTATPLLPTAGTPSGDSLGGQPGTSYSRGGRAGQPGATSSEHGSMGESGEVGGYFENGQWRSTGNGLTGGDGGHGQGGAGGGGSWKATSSNVYTGSAGGGGGSAGCGGKGGEGGGAGGASFGLVILNSTIVIDEGDFEGNGGANGGHGGAGGLGGEGGEGGFGTTEYCVDYDDCHPFHNFGGGRGGKGGNGANGGAGGGGAGGDSYGAYCAESTLTLEGGLSLEAGAGGLGGVSTGYSGPAGRSMESFGCDL
ncbi:hypothetical protein FRC96_18885 [Lujinxingia vulgaris]|uniref:PE-PGRS family protein n=1 Tax=Lujinxingia vulgaris TaxID=2600176 RepID=A0A5C6X1F6_9DELT|nr:hypothetical protein [Lujinxingia vulgaris]TXD32065.1 hypothetical protein FRC96_18885 [Lujinxingia vulgaris]